MDMPDNILKIMESLKSLGLTYKDWEDIQKEWEVDR